MGTEGEALIFPELSMTHRQRVPGEGHKCYLTAEMLKSQYNQTVDVKNLSVLWDNNWNQLQYIWIYFLLPFALHISSTELAR